TGDKANQACLPCHEKNVKDAAGHSRHKADGDGSKCVACHMPMTEFARMRRSDHSMRPPAPAATLAFKSPNACNLCHQDKDAAWSDDWVRKWHGDGRQRTVLERARLVDAARKGDWSRLPDMLAQITIAGRDEALANSLIRLLRACEDDRMWPAILKSLNDPSPLVRSSAAETLERRLTPEAIDALGKAARDEYRLVRVRAAQALARVPAASLSAQARKDVEGAMAEFMASAQSRPDDWASQYNLGNFHMARNDPARAVACFAAAAKLDPTSVPVRVNASLAYNALQQNDKAEASLREALKIEPASAAANFNLGLLLAELGRMDEAEAALRAAMKADLKMAAAAYNLGVLAAGRKNLDEAILWCRRAYDLRPHETKYGYTLGFYLYQKPNADESIRVLRQVIEREPADASPYALLAEIYERLGRLDDAKSLCERAATSRTLSPADRQRFEARLAELLKARKRRE
ncbi:MAG: tetratricopeptide repeat protein, partial [Planctomycetes bacterium]|nr:tetratricopeptide repeat protein [Planctomycetota bacterium]